MGKAGLAELLSKGGRMTSQRTGEAHPSNAEHAEMTDRSARDAAAHPSTAQPADTVQRFGRSAQKLRWSGGISRWYAGPYVITRTRWAGLGVYVAEGPGLSPGGTLYSTLIEATQACERAARGR